jgi:hypothetical protein
MALRSLCRPVAAPSGRPLFAAGVPWLCAALLASVACTASLEPFPEGPDQPQQSEQPTPEQPGEPAFEQEQTIALKGDNLSATNLAATNLAATNLASTNLAGANLGGLNLAATNLAGSNLAGTNLAGNNLAGNNLASTNLASTNLAGTNLASTNLAGTNLASTNLSGSNLAGTNLAGNNLASTNLASTNLAGTNTGRNIHNLAVGSTNGMLYSAEDMWLPKTGQCVVLGIGSTAFPKLLGQQTANAKISVALGKLPWGFASVSGGAVTLSAWEAVVWGDKTYCVFLLATPPSADWAGVAGFIKAIFRWNAPPSQTMEISGIEASGAVDPTRSTAIHSYTGMMNAAARFRAGEITATSFVAGEAAFVSATTNNESVMVDFSSWVMDKYKKPLVLGNITAIDPPSYAEALYIALDNGDGSVQIVLDDAASRAKVMPVNMTNSVVDLNDAYLAWKDGLGGKPIPRRCGGALYLKTWFNEPVETGKCDDGLTWAPGFCVKDAAPWSNVSGTVAPMNGYMTLNKSGSEYKRGSIASGGCGTMKTVLSETYVHMWEPNFEIAASGSCVRESDAAFCARRGKNCGSVTGTDNCGAARTVSNCGSCASPNSCGGAGVPNVCGSSNSIIYEAEALANNLGGSTYVHACPEAYIKVLGKDDPAVTAGACAGGARLRYLGGSSSNTITFTNVVAPTAGTYAMTIYAGTRDTRTFYLSINGGSAITINFTGIDFGTMTSTTKNVTLRAGGNTLKFYNNSSSTPDLDRIKITYTGSGGGCVAESNADFCARQGRNCGSVTGTDNCGATRTVSNCGSCVSPQTCGGGGTANVCGSSSSGSCGTAYSQALCLTYTAGTVVSSGGKNWTCTTANCMNCATFAGCAPGGTDCPFGVVWADGGTCGGSSDGSSGGGSTTTCAAAFAKSSCLAYTTGTKVSRNGRNWTCANGNCMNCATYTSCEPGGSGCPWGTVWTDSGACN